MPSQDLTKIEGFKELNAKLKRLPDKVKRSEILKIQKRAADPIIKAYSQALPVSKRKPSKKKSKYSPGNLSRSVKAETVPARKVGGNPSIVIRPAKKGKNDGFYRFMVTKKGVMTGQQIKKGSSRSGLNTVVDKARDTAIKSVGANAEKQVAEKTAAYIQKTIDRLS